MSKYLIAGIDPGATVGIALLDLEGKIVALASTQGGIGQAVRIIESYGTPSLVSCDTSPAPEGAKKVASLFSCPLAVPPRSIREEEKNQLSRGTAVANAHERDAYAAALGAFRSHQNKLRQIDALEDIPREQRERLKHLLLKGYKLTDAIMELGGQMPQEAVDGARKPQSAAPAFSPAQLQARISLLARENSNLRMALQKLEEEKGSLAHKIRLLENGVRTSLLRDIEVRKLRGQLHAALQRLGKTAKGREKPQAQYKLPAKKSSASPPQGQNEKSLPNAPSQGRQADLNVDEQSIDLQKLLAEYRRGRKN